MRPSFFALFIVLFLSCNPVTKEQVTTDGNINVNAPYLWVDKSFPKTLQISSSFSDAEVNSITEMNTAWSTALQDKKTFFALGARTPEITNSLSTLDSMLDGVLGIYKTAHWPSSLPGSALAVTQIFGRRHNVGSSSELVNIEHADILVNDDIHDFDTADAGPGYDLRTVILHELGHFLGLTHKSYSTNPDDSIMYPSISSSTNKRAPRTVDINDIAAKYGIVLNGGGGGASAIMAKNAGAYTIDPRDSGEPIKILIELHASGECVHKIDGIVKERHQLDINQR